MRTTGKVKWFNDAKGYGFITTPTGDFFAHYSEINKAAPGFKTMAEGDKVEFTPAEGTKGPAAKDIVVVR